MEFLNGKMLCDLDEMTLYDKGNQAGPQGTGSHYKSHLVKNREPDVLRVAGTRCSWMKVEIKKIGLCSVGRKNELVTTP